MKKLLLTSMLMAPLACMADGLPKEFVQLLPLARVSKLEDLTAKTTVYRIDFCLRDGCDMFAANPSKAAILADFSILLAAGLDDEYYELHKGSTAASRGAAADAILARDSKLFGCLPDKQQRKCVMHALYAKGGIKRYSYTEGDAITYEEVAEDGSYIPGGYD